MRKCVRLAPLQPTKFTRRYAQRKEQEGLTEQQRIFAEEYVKTGKQREAAIAAGYKAESASQQASRLLKKDKVLAYVRALRAQAAEGVCLQVEDVLRDLIEIKNRCMQAVPVQVFYELLLVS